MVQDREPLRRLPEKSVAEGNLETLITNLEKIAKLALKEGEQYRGFYDEVMKGLDTPDGSGLKNILDLSRDQMVTPENDQKIREWLNNWNLQGVGLLRNVQAWLVKYRCNSFDDIINDRVTTLMPKTESARTATPRRMTPSTGERASTPSVKVVSGPASQPDIEGTSVKGMDEVNPDEFPEL